jgi:hypothetical protein
MKLIIMELTTWISQNNCLHQIKRYKFDQRGVYIVDIDTKRYFIKRIKDLREYKIAKELETLELPTFQRMNLLLHSKISMERIIKSKENLEKYLITILIEKKKIYYYTLSEEIKGDSFLYDLSDTDQKDFKNILQVIFFSLRKAWSKLGFVHLDLHLGNIILQKIDHPILLNEKIIANHYLPIIIDFDRSITKTNMNLDYQNKTILNDIWKLLGILTLYLKDERGILVLDYLEYFIDRYEFQERKEEFVNLWFNVFPYEISDLDSKLEIFYSNISLF